MSDNKEELAPETTSAANHHKPRKTGILIAALVVILSLGAIGYGYLELSKVNASLAGMVSDLRQQQATNMQDLQELKQALSSNAAQQTTAAVTPPAAQPDMSQFNVSEAQALVKLAASQLKISNDAKAAFVTLQHAQSLLQHIQNPALDALRDKLSSDINALNDAQQVNFDEIYGKLSALDDKIDALPLPAAPLQNSQAANEKPKDYNGLPWWKIQWHKTMDALRKIVIVRYDGGNDAPLITPEEKMYLYANLHAQLQVVMSGLVNHQSGIYSAGLARLTSWVEKYFVQDAPQTKEMLAELNALKQTSIAPPSIDLAATQQLFEQYLAQNAQPQPAAAN